LILRGPLARANWGIFADAQADQVGAKLFASSAESVGNLRFRKPATERGNTTKISRNSMHTRDMKVPLWEWNISSVCWHPYGMRFFWDGNPVVSLRSTTG